MSDAGNINVNVQQEKSAPTNAAAANSSNANATAAATASAALPEQSQSQSPKAAAEQSSPKVENKKTPAKRTPSKRMSFIERAQKESEELVKNMGGSLELEGGRRTRSSTRGTPTRAAIVSTPPPAKKARTSPAGGASTPTRARGRGRKINTSIEPVAVAVEGTLVSVEKHSIEEEKKAQDTQEKDAVKAVEKEEKPNAGNVVVNDAVDAGSKRAENMSSAEQTTKQKDEVIGKPKESIEIQHNEGQEQAGEERSETRAADQFHTASGSAQGEGQSNLKDTAAESNCSKTSQKETRSMDTEEGAGKVIACQSEKKAEVIGTGVEVKIVKPAKSSVISEIATKEPTPEPMDVDSGLKSNDVEKMEDNNAADDAEKSSEVARNEKDGKETKEGAAVTVENNPTEPAVKNTAAEASGRNAGNVCSTESAVNSIDNDDMMTDEPEGTNATTAAAKETAQSAEEVVTPPATNEHKTENNLCEPKIATSPPITGSGDGSVTTPQICN